MSRYVALGLTLFFALLFAFFYQQIKSEIDRDREVELLEQKISIHSYYLGTLLPETLEFMDYDAYELEFRKLQDAFLKLQLLEPKRAEKIEPEFRRVEDRKDRYKSLNAQMVMSLIYIDKLIQDADLDSESSRLKLQIYIELLKLSFESRSDFSAIYADIERLEKLEDGKKSIFIANAKRILRLAQNQVTN